MSEDGCYGIQDGGASSAVVGHNVLMGYVDLMFLRGVPTEKFKFLATNKVFGFGGDARRQSDCQFGLKENTASWNALWLEYPTAGGKAFVEGIGGADELHHHSVLSAGFSMEGCHDWRQRRVSTTVG